MDVVSDFVQYARKNSRRLASAYPLTSSAMRPRCLQKASGRTSSKFPKRRYHQSDGIPKPLHGRLVRLSCTGQGSLPDHQGIHGRYPQEARGAGRAEADHPAMDSGLYRELARSGNYAKYGKRKSKSRFAPSKIQTSMNIYSGMLQTGIRKASLINNSIIHSQGSAINMAGPFCVQAVR